MAVNCTRVLNTFFEPMAANQLLLVFVFPQDPEPDGREPDPVLRLRARCPLLVDPAAVVRAGAELLRLCGGGVGRAGVRLQRQEGR